MRKLFALLTTLAILVAVPASSVVAQEERTVLTVYVNEVQTGVDASGSLVARGSYQVSFDGLVVETGMERSVYQVGDNVARGTRTYRSETGEFVMTLIKAWIVDADEANGVFTYAAHETIISSSDGVTGHGSGIAVVTVNPDGSFSLESWTDLIVSF